MKISHLIIVLLMSVSSYVAAQDNIEKLVILGSGPAGLTSAIYAGQVNLKPLVIGGNECDGQLSSIYHMENYPGFPEGINGAELVERMRIQAEKFGAHFYPGAVVDIDLSNSPFRLTFEDGHAVYSESIIIALGTSKRWLGLDSEEILKEKGVHGSATCDGPLYQDKEVVVAGGGDAALEEAIALTEFAAKVTLIHRTNKFNASSYLQEKIFSNKKIQVIWDAAIDEILDVSQGYVTGVVLRNLKTQEKTTYPCAGIFVAIGRQPNTQVFREQLELTSTGLIVVNSGTQTSIPGVFAAGDVSDPTYRKTTNSGAGWN